jgi:hypothetical protein
MARRINSTHQNALLDARTARFNGGTLEMYTGTQPATGGTAPSGTLLVTITLPATAFSAASSGSAAKAGTWSGTAVASGTAGWYRLKNAGGTENEDGAIAASGAEMTLDNYSIVSGGTVTISSFAMTQAAS